MISFTDLSFSSCVPCLPILTGRSLPGCFPNRQRSPRAGIQSNLPSRSPSAPAQRSGGWRSQDRAYRSLPTCWVPTQSCLLAQHPLVSSHSPLLGLSYRWLLNEFPNFIPADGRHFVSQTTGNLYIARTNASDLGNYSCLATSHMDFSTKSVFSKFAQLNLAAEGQGQRMWRKGAFPSEAVKNSSQGAGCRVPGLDPWAPPAPRPQMLASGPQGGRELRWSWLRASLRSQHGSP